MKAFVAKFHREINRLTAEKLSEVERKRREIEKVEREIRALVEAVNAVHSRPPFSANSPRWKFATPI